MTFDDNAPAGKLDMLALAEIVHHDIRVWFQDSSTTRRSIFFTDMGNLNTIDIFLKDGHYTVLREKELLPSPTWGEAITPPPAPPQPGDVWSSEDGMENIIKQLGWDFNMPISEINQACRGSTNRARQRWHEIYRDTQYFITFFMLWKSCTVNMTTWLKSLGKHPRDLIAELERIYRRNPISTLPANLPSDALLRQKQLLRLVLTSSHETERGSIIHSARLVTQATIATMFSGDTFLLYADNKKLVNIPRPIRKHTPHSFRLIMQEIMGGDTSEWTHMLSNDTGITGQIYRKFVQDSSLTFRERSVRILVGLRLVLQIFQTIDDTLLQDISPRRIWERETEFTNDKIWGILSRCSGTAPRIFRRIYSSGQHEVAQWLMDLDMNTTFPGWSSLWCRAGSQMLVQIVGSADE